MAAHKVTVYVVDINGVPTLQKIWNGKPGVHVTVKPGDGVRWANDGGNTGNLTVTFPPGQWPFAQPQKPLTAAPGHQTDANLKVKKPWKDPKLRFEYTIDVGGVTNDPDIIIDLNPIIIKKKKAAATKKKAAPPKKKK